MKSAKWWMEFLLAGCVCATVGASAALPRASETSGGVEWTYSIGDNGAIVTGASPAKGVLTLPASLGGQPVVEIGYAAFASCEELTAVTIPTGVKSIADRAFQYCSLLEGVSIPESVTNIGTMAFQYCESLPSLALPQGLDSIGANACYHCTGLQKLYVPLAWWGTSKAEVAGAECTVVYGELGKETVIFNANGGSCDTANRAYALGQAYGWLPEATHTYYAFTGWWTATNDGTLITTTNFASVEGRRVLYARWTPKSFQVVTFNPNGGVCDTTNRPYDFGSTYSPLPLPIREHYAFDGWWTSAYGGMNITEESPVTTNDARTLYAHWTLSEQVVTFNANGGVCDTTTQAFEIGKTYKPLPKPSLEGYSFDGWFTDYSGGDRISVATAVTATETRTLYAHWTLVEQKVTFDATGGKCGTASHDYAVGGTYDWFPEPTREGCVFDGWRTYGGEPIEPTDVVSQARTLTLYARWWGYVVTNNGAVVTSLYPARGNATIPNELGGYPITGIYAGAFSNAPLESGVGSMTIPDSVTSIGKDAFYGCRGLTNVTILGNVTNNWNDGNPFFGCTNLAAAVLGGKMTKIGDCMFSGCSGLTSLTIPESVTSIGEHAFSGCRGLTSLTIPEGVTNIGYYAFGGCSGLTSVTIPENVTSIGSYAFSDCSGLASVAIFGNITNNWNYDTRPFRGCTNLAAVVLGSKMTKIGNFIFYGCTGLTSVTIPASVTRIGDNAFDGCNGLTSVMIPDGVTSIGSYAFSYCSGLTSITIPDSVTSIGWEAFGECANVLFDTNTIPSVRLLDGWAVGNSGTLSGTLDLTGVRGIAGGAFYSSTNLTSVTIPASVTSIGYSAFDGCNGLTSVAIPDSVISIEERAFYRCNGLTNVVIPDSVTSIGSYAFSDCSGLTSLSIPKSVTNIEHSAFSGCSGLASMTIPDSVTSIESWVFSGCSGLTSVTIPVGVTSIGNHAFDGCSGLTSVAIPDSVMNIGERAFYGCNSLTNVVIPNNVTNIGAAAFSGCSDMVTVTIPDSITVIEYSAFDGCSGLTSMTIPDSVTSIGNWAFSGCSSLASVTIPDSVMVIGNYAFSECSALTSVTIPDSVTSIGEGAFSWCSGLMTLYAPKSWENKFVIYYPYLNDWEDYREVFWSEYARVPSGCTIIYYAPSKTRTGVPYSWLEEHGLGDGSAEGYEAAANEKAANGVNAVWECYVAGLNPTDPAATFTAEIAFTNGSPVVSWKPDLNEKDTKSERSYEVEGRLTMTNAWGPTNASSRFFRVKVALP